MEFTLRKWKLRDAPSIAKYANNPNIANNLRNAFPYPYTLADAWAYISFCIDNEKIGRYCRAIEINGEAVGSIGIFQQLDIYQELWRIGLLVRGTLLGKRDYVPSDHDAVRLCI